MRNARPALSVAIGAVLLAFAACQSSDRAAAPSIAGEPARTDSPGGLSPQKFEDPHLENLFRVGGDVYNGGVPLGDAGFASLQRRGIRTVISVDGATPDVEAARRYGLRYVHLPITYSGVTIEQRLALARALQELPGPVYIHCHHGKHRSPAAVAATLVTLGRLTPDEGVAFLQQAGTSPHYSGLYADVRTACAATPAQLASAPTDFPPIARPSGLVAAMSEAQHALDHLESIRDAGWKPPIDSPDLVPAAEAGRVENAIRQSPAPASLDPAALDDWNTQMESSRRLAQELEDAIVAGAPAEKLNPLLTALSRSCRDCHRVYRDQPQR